MRTVHPAAIQSYPCLFQPMPISEAYARRILHSACQSGISANALNQNVLRNFFGLFLSTFRCSIPPPTVRIRTPAQRVRPPQSSLLPHIHPQNTAAPADTLVRSDV